MRVHQLLEPDVLSGDGGHVAAGQVACQSVVAVHVLLELGGAADQQTPTTELEKFAPHQRRRKPPLIAHPVRRVAVSAQIVGESLHRENISFAYKQYIVVEGILPHQS